MVFQDYITNQNHYISNTEPMAARLGRMVTYFDGLLPIKSNNPLIV